MRSASKTAAYGLFSALILALTVTGEPISPENPRNPARSGDLPAPELTLSDRVSTTGFYGISWGLPPGAAPEGYTLARHELEERPPGEDWTPRYSGPDEATTLTGMPDGDYAYRVRAVFVSTAADPDPAAPPDTVMTAWSPPVTIEVRHHSLARAFGFLATGAIVFIATLVLIVTGHRRSKQ